MARINDTGHGPGSVRDTGSVLPRIDSTTIASALGAEEVQFSRTFPREAVLLTSLRSELLSRLESSGGRPAIRGATKRPKIPVEPGDWAGLARAAERLSKLWGRNLTAGQLASQLLKGGLHELLGTFDALPVRRDSMELKDTPVELAQAVKKAIELTSSILERRAQRVKTSVPASGLRVTENEVRLVQVIASLLDNAAKFAPRNGTLEIDATRESERVVLKVKDSGISAPDAFRARIFESFGSSSVDRAPEHSGLGLPTVRTVVEFDVRLPLLLEDA